MNQDNAQTSFDMTDLIIRQRVDAYKAALEANKGAKLDVQDDMLSQFSREVDNMQAQLAQVEKAFGKDDPMAQVLREALESAQCRLDTRKIELEMAREDEEEAAMEERKLANQPAKPLAFERKQPVEDKGTRMAWLFLMPSLNNSAAPRFNTGLTR